MKKLGMILDLSYADNKTFWNIYEKQKGLEYRKKRPRLNKGAIVNRKYKK